MIKNIFFDIDGTVYEEKIAKVKAETQIIKYIADELNMTYFDVYEIYKKSKKDIFSREKNKPNRNDRIIWYEETLKRLKCSSISPKKLGEKYWNIIKENIELYEDFKLILPELKNEYNLFVVTDELLEIQEEKLKMLGIINIFKKIISSTQVNLVKPNPEIFEYALKLTNSNKEETIMIGDNPSRDIEGAKAVGLKTIWFKRGKYEYYQLEDKNTPDIIITNYLELINKLNNFTKNGL